MQGKPQLHSKFKKKLKKRMTLALYIQLNPINIQQKPKLTPRGAKRQRKLTKATQGRCQRQSASPGFWKETHG